MVYGTLSVRRQLFYIGGTETSARSLHLPAFMSLEEDARVAAIGRFQVETQRLHSLFGYCTLGPFSSAFYANDIVMNSCMR